MSGSGYVARRKALGLCVWCADPTEDGRTMCKRHREAIRAARREQLYGLSKEQYEALLTEQEGRCPICGTVLEDRPAVDHDHRTGQVRGILCRHCNWGLGHLRDDPVLVLKALVYLLRKTEEFRTGVSVASDVVRNILMRIIAS